MKNRFKLINSLVGNIARLSLIFGILLILVLVLLYLFFSRQEEAHYFPSPIVNQSIHTERLSIKGCKLPQKRSVSKNIEKVSFYQWLQSFQEEARNHGISEEIFLSTFKDIKPIQQVIKFDRNQKEYSTTFYQYLNNNISNKRIFYGRAMLRKYHKLLAAIEKEYGVPPQILISLWAMESSFGMNMGDFSTINTLATLAHEGRRRDFFRGELMCALQIIEEGHIPTHKMKSSWAGAMGQPQFMPSTFFYYAVDGNQDGKKDIWNTTADVFASAANYLNKIGWQANQAWGVEVRLPKNFDPYEASFSKQKNIAEWHKLGVKQANGKPLSTQDAKQAAIILPSGIKGPAFLIYPNFKVLRKWNRSTYYVLTVSHLADRLLKKNQLIKKVPKDEKPLSRQQVISLQTNLSILGYYKDSIDGMIGLNTKDAIREYQKSYQLLADAYPSIELLADIQQKINFK